MSSVLDAGSLVVENLVISMIPEALWRKVLKVEIVSIVILLFPNWLFIISQFI
jgi:hypothetical protein